MKIAVCISGGIRYPHLGLESIKKIIPNEDIKVFIHTWKVENIYSFHQTVSGLKYKEINKVIEQNFSFLEKYNYQKLLIENYDECTKKFENIFSELKFVPATDDIDEPRSDVGPISMHYSIYKSNQLKKEYEIDNNMIFDWVIRMRTDSDFRYDKLDLNSLSCDLNIPSGEDWNELGINDQFAIGKSHTMDIYSNFYNNIYLTQSSKYYPEVMLLSYLNKMNIFSNRIDFPVRINNGIDFRKIWYPHLVK
jgi:hypothetical protein